MAKPLSVLIIEDNQRDAQLIVRELTKAGYTLEFERVETPAQMRHALEKKSWEMVISDFRMPEFYGFAALKLIHEAGQDIPFILVSGSIGKKTAVNIMKAGASDYIIKGNLTRLVPSIERELVQAKIRLERKRAEGSLHASDALLQAAINFMPVGLWIINAEGNIVTSNAAAHRIWAGVRIVGIDQFGEYKGWRTDSGELIEAHEWAGARAFEKGETSIEEEVEIECFDGTHKIILDSAVPLRESDGSIGGAITINQDITERKRAEITLRVSEDRYHEIFEESPISLWEKDFSAVKQRLDDLRAKGVIDISAYLEAHPDEVAYCASLVKVVDVNQASLKLFNAKNKDQLINMPVTFEDFIKELVGIASGKTKFTWESNKHTLTGEQKVVNVVWSVASKYKSDYSKVIISIIDITERKQVEKALQIKNLVFDDSIAANSVADLNGLITEANEAFLWFWGFSSKDEVVGKPIAHFINDPNDAVVIVTALNNTGQWEGDYSAKKKDGSTFIAHGLATTIKDERGQVVGYQSAVLDVTQKREEEKELKRQKDHLDHMVVELNKSREQYMLAVRGTNDGIWDWDLRTDELYLSEKWKDQLGYADHELVNSFDTIENLLHPEDKQTVMNYVRRYIEGEGKVYSLEFRMRHKDGSYRWILARGEAIRDKNGKAHRMAGSHTDITESKLAIQEIQLREERYRGLVETQNNLIARTDLNNILIFANDAYCVFNGKSRGELIGRKYSSNILPEYQKISSEAHLSLLKPPHHYQIEVQHQSSLGLRWLRWEGSVVENKDGKIIEYQGVATDITEQKQNQIDLMDSVSKLRTTVEGTIETIALIVEARDPYTSGHQQRVADISVKIAEDLGLPKEQIRGIYMAGLIHDLGKIQVPAEILSKPGQLTKLEFKMIQTHSKVGFDLVKNIESPWPLAQIIYQHHERMDGSGYPRKLKGDKILIEAQIIGIADVIEAMSSHRPYRPALGLEAGLKEININKGTLYDKELVATYLKVFKKGYRFDK